MSTDLYKTEGGVGVCDKCTVKDQMLIETKSDTIRIGGFAAIALIVLILLTLMFVTEMWAKMDDEALFRAQVLGMLQNLTVVPGNAIQPIDLFMPPSGTAPGPP